MSLFVHVIALSTSESFLVPGQAGRGSFKIETLIGL